jgi:hypothetical protein
MRISVIRTLAACVLLGFVSSAASHWSPPYSDTEKFRYRITKPDFQFQVGQALSFNDFEDLSFCSLTYNGANPTANPNVIANPAATASLSPATSRTFAFRTQGIGNVHPKSSDTYTVTYTIQGVSRAQIATL